MIFYGGVGCWKRNKRLDFGSDLDHQDDYPIRNRITTDKIMSGF